MINFQREVFFEKYTVTPDRAHELITSGEFARVCVELGGKAQKTPMLIKIDPSNSDLANEHHQVYWGIRQMLPILLPMSGMSTVPASHFFGHEDTLTIAEDGTLPERRVQPDNPYSTLQLMSSSVKGSGHVGIYHRGKFSPVIPIMVDSFPKAARALLSVNDPHLIPDQQLPRPLYRFLREFPQEEHRDINRIASVFSNCYQNRPSGIAYATMYPPHYYQDTSTLNTIVCLYNRHHLHGNNAQDIIDSLNDLFPVIIRNKSLLSPDMGTRVTDNLTQLIDYCIQHRKQLDNHIETERFYTSSDSRVLQLEHYQHIFIQLMIVNGIKLMRVPCNDWIQDATMGHYNNNLTNTILDSFLPELTQSSPDRNPLSPFKTMRSLICNISLTDIPADSLFPRLQKTTTSSPRGSLKPFSTFRLQSLLSSHSTKIDDNPVFGGEYTNIPTFYQKNFSDNLRRLQHVVQAPKLSGAQFKLPLTLTDYHGQKRLTNNTDVGTFTHIGKFPMPTFEDITISEWLALELLKRSGVNVARNQLVSATSEVETYTPPPQETDNEQSLSSASLAASLNDELDQQQFLEGLLSQVDSAFSKVASSREKQNCPPFLISERFDIPNASEPHVRYLSFDMGALLRIPSERKYQPSMEQVAEALRLAVPEVSQHQVCHDLFTHLCASVMLHNNDLHAKNITLLMREDMITGDISYSMSPIYDIIITPMVLSDNTHATTCQQALKICGTNYPGRNELIQFATHHLSLSRDESELIFDSLLNKLLHHCNEMKISMPEQISSHSRWADTVRTGLSHVQQNLLHLKRYGQSFGTNNSQPTSQAFEWKCR